MHMTNDHHHDHDHGDRNSYFLDQLCSIAVCAAYAGVVAAMFYAKFFGSGDQQLINIIVPWIQYMLLGGAVALLLLTIIRAVGVWQASKQVAFDPHAGHDHAAGDHHEHGWSPWKYIPLVIPLVLFIGLGLPDGRMIRAYERDLADQGAPKGSIGNAGKLDAIMQGMVASAEFNGTDPGGSLSTAIFNAVMVSGGLATEIAEEEVDARPDASPSLGDLDQIAGDPFLQESYQNFRRVETEGTFYPGNAEGTRFRVARLRVACCLGDARPAMIMCTSRKPAPFQPGEWVAVQGKLDFVASEGKWYPVMHVYKVYKKPQPAYPYLK
jgi:phosphate/sulfate permease